MVQNIIGDKLVTDRQQTDRQQTDIFELTPIHMGGRERMGGKLSPFARYASVLCSLALLAEG